MKTIKNKNNHDTHLPQYLAKPPGNQTRMSSDHNTDTAAH